MRWAMRVMLFSFFESVRQMAKTANMSARKETPARIEPYSIPKGKLVLPNGVYAVNAVIDGVQYASVTNVGVRPTFGLESKGIVVESFLLDAAGDFYGETAKLEFIEMLRGEKRFDSAEALKAQIGRDIIRAKEILKSK